jgi:hypothetical protein
MHSAMLAARLAILPVFLLAACAGPSVIERAVDATPSSNPPATTVVVNECPDTGLCASPNSAAVPDVVGLGLGEASETLAEFDYGCMVWLLADGETPGLVVEQDPTPGTFGFMAQGIHLTVVRPVETDNLPPNCVDRLREGRFAQRHGHG